MSGSASWTRRHPRMARLRAGLVRSKYLLCLVWPLAALVLARYSVDALVRQVAGIENRRSRGLVLLALRYVARRTKNEVDDDLIFRLEQKLDELEGEADAEAL